MSVNYYVRNICWGLLFYLIFVFVLRNDFSNPLIKLFLIIGFINVLAFPIAKGFLEELAHNYYSEERGGR